MLGSIHKVINFGFEANHILTDEIYQDQTNHKAGVAQDMLNKQHILYEAFRIALTESTKHEPWMAKYLNDVNSHLVQCIVL